MTNLESLEFLFRKFANFGSRRGTSQNEMCMDGTKLAKLARDSGILDASLNRTDIDIIFNKVKDKGKRKINFEQFIQCTKLWARKKGVAHSMLIHTLSKKSLVPRVNGTIPKPNSFHDDRSKYTRLHRDNHNQRFQRRRADILEGFEKFEEDKHEGYLKSDKKNTSIENDFSRSKYGVSQEVGDVESSVNYKAGEYDWKIKVEGKDYIIHPDWEKRINYESVGCHDKFFYVNRITNERSWSIPTVSATPPE